MAGRDEEPISIRSGINACGARFAIPAECRLPAGHHGEHAPDVIARALVTIGIASDELDADRREFDRERAQMRSAHGSAMQRVRILSIVVSVAGCVVIAAAFGVLSALLVL